MKQPAYLSFLIRMGQETDARENTWQSTVKHIQSGHEHRFATVDALLDFLRQQAEATQDSKPTES